MVPVKVRHCDLLSAVFGLLCLFPSIPSASFFSSLQFGLRNLRVIDWDVHSVQVWLYPLVHGLDSVQPAYFGDEHRPSLPGWLVFKWVGVCAV